KGVTHSGSTQRAPTAKPAFDRKTSPKVLVDMATGREYHPNSLGVTADGEDEEHRGAAHPVGAGDHESALGDRSGRRADGPGAPGSGASPGLQHGADDAQRPATQRQGDPGAPGARLPLRPRGQPRSSLPAGPGRPGAPHVRRLGREPGAQPGGGASTDAGEARRALGADRQERGGRRMNGIDGIVLTFLLNALWQIPAAVAGGLLGTRLLRRAPARQRHGLWLAVAGLCLALPAASLRRADLPSRQPAAVSGVPAAAAPLAGPELAPPGLRPARYAPAAGAAVAAGYAFLLLFRGFRLGQTWRRTLGLARRASPLDERAIPRVAQCLQARGVAGPIALFVSGEVTGPVTLGALRPAILLPPRFLDDASPDEALSALGHEMAHVRRRDYCINLLCEALLLPVAFHPAV